MGRGLFRIPQPEVNKENSASRYILETKTFIPAALKDEFCLPLQEHICINMYLLWGGEKQLIEGESNKQEKILQIFSRNVPFFVVFFVFLSL